MNKTKIRDLTIYKLECKNPKIMPFYIGSTSNLYQRCAGHKTACNNKRNKKYNNYLYEFIREFGGFEGWRIVPLWRGKGNFQFQKEIEKKFIDTYQPKLNTNVIGRTLSQWRIDNKEKINLWCRNHRVKNIEKHREQLRASYEKHKNKRVIYSKKYNALNREKINKKNNTEYPCLCGAMVKHRNKNKHRQSKEHQEKLKSVFNNNALFNFQLQQTTSRKTRRKIRTIKKKK